MAKLCTLHDRNAHKRAQGVCVVAPETICTSIRSWADALRRIPQASELECNGKNNNAISECNDKNNNTIAMMRNG
jgi:hypothetical protein